MFRFFKDKHGYPKNKNYDQLISIKVDVKKVDCNRFVEIVVYHKD